MWKAINNIVPIRCNLISKGLSISDDCPMCGKSGETIEHTLLLCKRAREIWEVCVPTVIWAGVLAKSLISLWKRLGDILTSGELEVVAVMFWRSGMIGTSGFRTRKFASRM